MYPTIYLIILLSVQETPKVLANQISVRACLGRLMGTAEGRECFYPTALRGILLAGTTYEPLLSSKHGPRPQARQYTPLSRRNTETGAQLSHSPCSRGGLGLLGGIRLAPYAEETCPGLVLHRCLCLCACICAWKIPLQTSQSQSLLLKETGFLQQEGIFHLGPILHLLKARMCSYTHTL